MRTLMVALGLGGAAVVLQGCGGGGGDGPSPSPSPSPSPATCLNDKFDLISQSSTGGSITGSIKGVPGLGEEAISMDLRTVQKIDLDKFNLRMDITSGTIGYAGGNMNVAVHLIVNAANKDVIIKYDISSADGSGGSFKNCTKITSDKIPNPAVIAMGFKSIILPFIQQMSKCGGNDGTDDTWKIGYDSAQPTPGMPEPPIPKGDSINLDSVIKMNKASLISEVSENIAFTGKEPSSGEKISVSIDIDAKFDGSSAGGPTDSDLDYSDWGICYPMTPPGNNINTIFQPQDHTAVTAVLDKVVLDSALRKIFLASMRTEPKSEDKHVVV